MYFDSGENQKMTDIPSLWIPLVPRTLRLPMQGSLGNAFLETTLNFSLGILCLHLMKVTTIFPFPDCPCSVSSYHVGKDKLLMYFQTKPAQKKCKRKGEFEPCKLGDKIDWNVFHSWLFREWTLMTLKYCKSFNIKSMPGHGPAFRRQLILWRIHTTVSSSCWSS